MSNNEKQDDSSKFNIKDIALGFNIPQIIRFFYSGFLFIGLLQFSSAKILVNDSLKSLNEITSLILIFFIGVIIWTIYHQIIGEFAFFHVAHFFHKLFFKNLSDMVLLENCGVPKRQKRIAYEMIRNLYFEKQDKEWVELNHAHNQILDITWIEIFSIIGYFYFFHHELINGYIFLLFIGIICIIGSVMIDIRQHSIEKILMLKNGETELKNWLTKMGII
jgi:hypothetical protein